ncbi:unnamed protein product, partial [Rotaria socialis]
MAQAINKGNQSSQRKPPVSLSRTMSIPATSENFLLRLDNRQISTVENSILICLGEALVPMIHNYEQIDSIYIYCDNKNKHEKWANKIKKIKGVFQDLEPIFDAFRRDIRQCEDDLVPLHIL